MCTCTLPYSGAGPCHNIVRWEGLHAERSSNPIIQTSEKSVRRPEAQTQAPGIGSSQLNPIPTLCTAWNWLWERQRLGASPMDMNCTRSPELWQPSGRIQWAVSTSRVSRTLDIPSKLKKVESWEMERTRCRQQTPTSYQPSDTLLV